MSSLLPMPKPSTGAPACRIRQRALDRFERHGTDDQRGGKDVLRPEQCAQPQSGRHLGTVEQRQPFLGREHERLNAGAAQPIPRGQALAPDPDLAHPDQGCRQVCERRQIPRGADRALGGNTGVDARIDQRKQGFDHLGAHTRAAPSQADGLEDHHQPNDLVGKQRTGTGAVREHEVPLQLAEPIGGDGLMDKFAEAGVDAVGNRAPLEDSGHHPVRGLDLLQRPLVQPHRDALVAHAAQLGQGHAAGGKDA